MRRPPSRACRSVRRSFGEADATQRRLVPPVLKNLEHWQDIKFGLLMHWGPHSQCGVVESWSICGADEGWCQRSQDDYIEYKRRYEGLQKTFNC